MASRVRTHPDGFVPPAVIRSRSFVLGTLAAMSLFCGYLAMLFAAPLLLLRDHDWSTTEIGLVLLPAALMGAAASRVAARLNTTRDPFRVAAGLALASAAGLAIGGAGGGAPVATAVALGLVLGGFAASQGGLVAQVPLAVDPSVRSVATGLFQLCSMLGGAMELRPRRGPQRPARARRRGRRPRRHPHRGRRAGARGGPRPGGGRRLRAGRPTNGGWVGGGPEVRASSIPPYP